MPEENKPGTTVKPSPEPPASIDTPSETAEVSIETPAVTPDNDVTTATPEVSLATNPPDSSTTEPPADPTKPINDHVAANVPPRRLLSKKVVLIIAATVIVLAGTGTAAAMLLIKSKPADPNTNATTKTTKSAANPSTSKTDKTDASVISTAPLYNPACTNKSAVKNSATWTGKREKLSDLNLFSPISPNMEGDPVPFAYYKLGQTTAGEPIIMVISNEGNMEENSALLIQKTDGKYQYVEGNSYFLQDGKFIFKASDKVVDTADSYFPDLCAPETITYKEATLKAISIPTQPTTTSMAYAKKVAETKLTTDAYGTLYEYLYADEPLYKESYYMLVLPDTRVVEYTMVGPLEVDKPSPETGTYVAPITWNDGSRNTAPYSTKYRGCGTSTTLEIAKGLTDSDLVKLGTGPQDQTVYGFASASNPLFAAYYKDYSTDYPKGSKTGMLADNLRGLTAEEWLKQRPVVVLKDKLGRDVVYMSDTYNVGGGCGKPVVYLYPTKPMNVSVKVGANISVSEPTYGKGWTVFAQPSGKLTVNGKPYDSLYWEGFGHGAYPLTNAGTVVSQSQLKTTIASQLKQLGLNDKERADFQAFWLDRLPRDPYVRLTWFGTSQMQQLAPLTISPRPDTLIRVFLDYEGLDRPIQIPAQKLTALPRQGFTVVEWGGLLR